MKVHRLPSIARLKAVCSLNSWRCSSPATAPDLITIKRSDTPSTSGKSLEIIITVIQILMEYLILATIVPTILTKIRQMLMVMESEMHVIQT